MTLKVAPFYFNNIVLRQMMGVGSGVGKEALKAVTRTTKVGGGSPGAISRGQLLIRNCHILGGKYAMLLEVAAKGRVVDPRSAIMETMFLLPLLASLNNRRWPNSESSGHGQDG